MSSSRFVEESGRRRMGKQNNRRERQEGASWYPSHQIKTQLSFIAHSLLCIIAAFGMGGTEREETTDHGSLVLASS
ncbi:hypothetical protein OUZ56_007156 [Daphnia magna]|uniref:Uncharacterized protein n=1 Tax=Daphnia magna TaxID=35525 RepID=A0ABQ9YXR4_9CRUS|nr:hypothetical protein OUZ56_007156 [Daphnia magna]